MTTEELKVIITAQTRQFETEIGRVKKEVSGLQAETAKSTSGIGKMFKGFSVVAIVAGLTKLSKSAIEIASDLDEVQNVVDVAFGNMNDEVNKFAKNAITQLGMSELSAKQFASTFMAIGNGMGIVNETGKNMALSLTTLAGDMASFYNVSQDETASALRAVYTGETEALKKYGIVMTQINLQEFARQQGITKTMSAMSQAELVALRYKYVIQATANAQGDFARTSGSWANQTRILKEQWNSLLGTIGQGLVKVLTPAIQFLNTILGYLVSIANMIARAFGGKEIKSASTNIGNVASGVGDIGSNLDEATSSAKKLHRQLMSFDELNVIASDTSNSSGNSGSSGYNGNIDIDFSTIENESTGLENRLLSIVDVIKKELQPAFDGFIKGLDVDGLISKFESLFKTVKDKGSSFLDGIDFGKYKSTFEEFMTALGTFISSVIGTLSETVEITTSGTIDAFSGATQTFVNDTVPTVTDQVSSSMRILSSAAEATGSVYNTVFNEGIKPDLEELGQQMEDTQNIYNNWWDEHGEKTTNDIIQLITDLKELLLIFWNTVLKPIWDYVRQSVDKLWNETLKPTFEDLGEDLSDLWDAIVSLWEDCIKPIFTDFQEEGQPGLIESISRIIDTLAEALRITAEVTSSATKMFTGLIEFISGIFTGNWSRAWEGIKKIFVSIVNSIITGVNILWTGIYRAVSGIVNLLGKLSGAIGKVFGKNWSFSIPNEPPLIPQIRLAKGGIATGSVFANIGEKGKEAVLPLENHTEWMDVLADKLSERTTGPSKIILMVDDRELGQATINSINKITKQTGSLQLQLV